MPLYFFHLHESGEVSGYEGRLLPNLDEAIAYAVGEVRCIMAADVVTLGSIQASKTIEITDEKGEILHTVRFADVVRVDQDG